MLWLVLMLVAPGVALMIGATRPSAQVRRISQNLLISYITLAAVIVGAELYLRYGFAQSENVLTKATTNWLDRHWHTNTLGFRDREWTPEALEGRQVILLAGDSFAAGWGIEDPADRFGDVLAAQLGEDYAVLNIAEYGRSTPEELAIIQGHPVQNPDVILLQYFLNDISYAQLRLGLQLTPSPTPWWAEASHLLNFMYHRLLLGTVIPVEDWQDYDFESYDNPVIWETHRAEIEAVIDHAEERDIRLVVVIFPNMLYPFRSVPYVDRVAQVFEARDVEVLRLFDEANAWPLEDRIVSPRDTHPSVAFHHMVGDMLYEQFFAE